MRWMSSVAFFALGITHSIAQSPPPLFTQVDDASQPTPPRAFAAFPVGINFPGLDAAPTSLAIQLPGIGTTTAERTALKLRAGGGYDWIGKTASHDVVLSVDDRVITGFIRGGTDTFSILSDMVGSDVFYSLQHMNPAAFPEDLVLENPVVKGATPAHPERRCFGKDFEPIDLLVIYSPEALAVAGGDVPVMENSIFNAVASASATLANSGVSTFFNLVSVLPAPPTLIEEGNADDPVNARLNAEVIALRTHWKADMVTYITSIGVGPQGQPFCGATPTQRRAGVLGFGYDFAPNAVNVVTWACGVQNNDLSHEAGHNAGLDHNPGFTLATPQQNLFPFAYGHHVNGLFRDDMSGTSANACPDECPRQMFFSDPTRGFDGVPRGVEGTRDNAQVYRKMFRCMNTFADYVFGDGVE